MTKAGGYHIITYVCAQERSARGNSKKGYWVGRFGERQRPEKGVMMIKSMTGFGRAELEEDDRRFTVEMKSVNHRYLDVSIKMPKKLNYFESVIR